MEKMSKEEYEKKVKQVDASFKHGIISEDERQGLITEYAKQADKGCALVAQRFPTADGWRNVNVCGHSWRCNRWEVVGYGGRIVESRFVTVTPDGLVIQ